MPIDYSKWDHIELSDDSDIEVHPNVDKNSFIRWKQQSIREKRAERNHEIKELLVQLTMYKKLNDRVHFLIDTLEASDLLDVKKVKQTLDAKYDPKERFNYEALKKEKGSELRKGLQDLDFDAAEMENTPPYNEMVEDLFIQLIDEKPEVAGDKSGQKLVEELKAHTAKIDDYMSARTIKLDEVLNEKASLITPDDYHTGFDRVLMNKGESKPSETTKEQSIEVINSPGAATTAATEQKPKYEPKIILDDLILESATQEFGDILESKLRESAEFLLRHTSICTEQQKDALLMSAFDVQLEGRTSDMRRIIHQSLLLQYVAQLAGTGAGKPNADATVRAIKLFFSKLEVPGPARDGFHADVDNTVNHIKTRCKVIEQEQLAQAQDEEQLIQLRALDDGTELTVNMPEEGSDEYQVFTEQLPQNFQDAVKSESLDRINEEFAKLKVEDAEKILEIFNECGVIGVSGYLENEEEFSKLQEESREEAKAMRAAQQEHEFTTQDEVD